jgi:hypothetical protein
MAKRRNREFESICSLAAMRVHVAYKTVVALLPDADDRKRVKIARQLLSLCDGKDRSKKITPAQAEDIILPHFQCIEKSCPALCFWEPISRSLNLFFEED